MIICVPVACVVWGWAEIGEWKNTLKNSFYSPAVIELEIKVSQSVARSPMWC